MRQLSEERFTRLEHHLLAIVHDERRFLAMGLELYSTNELSQPLVGEISAFLDSQETSHVFQFPQWSVSGARFALFREGGDIRWFVTFGTHLPLGSSVPWVRALIANRGPVCDDQQMWQAASEEFIEQMRQERFTYFDAVPDWIRTAPTDPENRLRNSGWQEVGAQRTSLRLEITKSEDDIFANFRKNTRYEIRRAERIGVSVAPAAGDMDINDFLSSYARLALRKGFAAEAPDDLRSAIKWLTTADARGGLLLARFENQVYGGAVIARSGRRCWYVWGATDKQDHFNVGHILQWKALQWARSHGCDEYDFGGYTPGATSGPAWFKAGFGGKVVSFVRPHRLIIRRGCYRMFNLVLPIRELTNVRQ